MKEPALLEPIELTDAELDMVSGGQYSVTVDRIAFFGLSLGAALSLKPQTVSPPVVVWLQLPPAGSKGSR